jgi:S1-C subfamily serine protease
MRKISTVILTLLTFISYSQSIDKNIKNEVTALKNYHGGFNVDLIIDYELINNNWVKQKTDKGLIFYDGDSIYIKRNQDEWLFRELNLINYNSTLKTYIYNSQFGKTYINEDFKIITFFDAQNENKKYEYYIGKYDQNIIPNDSFSDIEISKNQRINYYDKDYNKIIKEYEEKIRYYSIYEVNEKNEIIDYVKYYDFYTNLLLWKYTAYKISNKSLLYDIVDGEHYIYDRNENIRTKIVHINPNKLDLFNYKKTNNDEVYDFDVNGKITKYTKYKNGTVNIIVNYDSNQDVKNAKSNEDSYFFQGNPDSGYELIYNEEFNEKTIFSWKENDYDAGKRELSNGGYVMESKNNGGISDIIDIGFDMNKSDWVITSTLDRLNSIQGAGIIIGASEDGNSTQMFLISGDGYFNHYNIYNGFNISKLKDWIYSNSIKTYNSKNVISIMKIKDDVFVSVNGQSIYTTKFTVLNSSTIGLFTDKMGNKIKFDNLVIKKLNAELPQKFFNIKNYIASKSKFKGNGSGFLVNNQGILATNYHVIEGAKEIYVESNKKDYKCSVVAIDKINDLAILKIQNFNFNPIKYTISSITSETGSSIFTLGFPYALSLLGNEIKLTDGIISSTSGYQNDIKTYQISVPVQPGNSGGPLFDDSGNVIGIVSSKFTLGDNVSYAIKSNYLLKLLTKNNISINKKNSISNLKLTDKVKELSKTTLLIKLK